MRLSIAFAAKAPVAAFFQCGQPVSATNCSGLAIVSVKPSKQLGYLKKISDFRSEVYQYDVATPVAYRCVSPHQLADSRAIDVRYMMITLGLMAFTKNSPFTLPCLAAT